jgi:hypothetical protein
MPDLGDASKLTVQPSDQQHVRLVDERQQFAREA